MCLKAFGLKVIYYVLKCLPLASLIALSGILKSDKGDEGKRRGVRFWREIADELHKSLNESEFVGLIVRSITSVGVISTGIDLDLGICGSSLCPPGSFVDPEREVRVGEFLALPNTVEASTPISGSSSKRFLVFWSYVFNCLPLKLSSSLDTSSKSSNLKAGSRWQR